MGRRLKRLAEWDPPLVEMWCPGNGTATWRITYAVSAKWITMIRIHCRDSNH